MSERNVVMLLHRYRLEQGVAFFPAAGIDRQGEEGSIHCRSAASDRRRDSSVPSQKNRIDGHERVVCENELRSL